MSNVAVRGSFVAAAVFASFSGAQALAQSAPPAPPPASSVEILERLHAEDPDPLILLRLAELSVRAERCEEGLSHYERFFALCAKCDALTLGVKRFEQTVEKCVVSIDRESEVRGLAKVPRSKEPARSPADATVREVTDLLKEARAVDGPRAIRALLTLAEAGQGPNVRLLNDLREVAFTILATNNATKEQVERFLLRIKRVNLGRYEELRAELAKAEDVPTYNAIRRQVMDALVLGSVGGREARSTNASCRPNDELEWGQLTISSSPWSEAYLNGEKLGSTPVARADALAGCVTLRLVDPETGASVLKNVTVRSNKVAVVQVDLKTGEDRVRYE